MIARLLQSRTLARKLRPLAQAVAWGALLGTLLLALLVASRPAHASVAPPYTPDVTLAGPPFSLFGFAIAPAGDVNDDGIADMLAGSYQARQAFVYLGGPEGVTETHRLEMASSQAGDQFGYSVDGDGDVNGDGIADFVVSAPNGQVTTGTVPIPVGLVYVYHGASAGQPAPAITLTGELADDKFGWSVAMAGDVDHDGFDDVVVGALQYGTDDAGRAYLYHGSATGIVASPALTLTGEAELDNFGNAVAGAGDVNGDGFDDVVIGAWQNNDGGTRAGKVYVYFGSEDGLSPGDPFTLAGTEMAELGTSVAGVGDVNGDGYADIMVGAARAAGAGAAYLLLGSPDGPVTPPIGVATGEAAGDALGFAVQGAGDLNGDGFDDLVTGAYLHDSAAANAGKVYAFAGCINQILPEAIFTATGEDPGENYGHAAAGVGDVNGDGVDDLAVGTMFDQVKVYYGVKGGGCQAQIELDVSVGLAGFTPQCGAGSTLQVPQNAAVEACYRVKNSGTVTLTQHVVTGELWGIAVPDAVITLGPGGVYTHVVTHTVTVDAGSTVSWTAALPILGPGGISSRPPGKQVEASASATAAVTLLPPTSDLDNDGVPDHEEGTADKDHDNVPAYLDPDEQPEQQPGGEDGPSTVYLPMIIR